MRYSVSWGIDMTFADIFLTTIAIACGLLATPFVILFCFMLLVLIVGCFTQFLLWAIDAVTREGR